MATYSENPPDLEKVPLSALTVNLEIWTAHSPPPLGRKRVCMHISFPRNVDCGLPHMQLQFAVVASPPPFLIRAAIDNAGLRRELIYLGI
jgi:hypothetical protein